MAIACELTQDNFQTVRVIDLVSINGFGGPSTDKQVPVWRQVPLGVSFFFETDQNSRSPHFDREVPDRAGWFDTVVGRCLVRSTSCWLTEWLCDCDL